MPSDKKEPSEKVIEGLDAFNTFLSYVMKLGNEKNPILQGNYGCVVGVENRLTDKNIWGISPSKQLGCIYNTPYGSEFVPGFNPKDIKPTIPKNNVGIMATTVNFGGYGCIGMQLFYVLTEEGGIAYDILVVWNAWNSGGYGVAVDVRKGHNKNWWATHDGGPNWTIRCKELVKSHILDPNAAQKRPNGTYLYHDGVAKHGNQTHFRDDSLMVTSTCYFGSNGSYMSPVFAIFVDPS